MQIAFIGGGHMTTGLVGGLCSRGVPPGTITVADPLEAARTRLVRDFGVRCTADNDDATRDAAVVVLAVKPQDMAMVARGIAAGLATRRPVVISVAAGIRVHDLARWIGPSIPVVRAMPNRPALIGAGITALFAGADVQPAAREQAERVMTAVGATLWVAEESQLDVVTAISGSGPAYFFLLSEVLEAAGIGLGLPQSAARRLAVETARGAGRMLAENPETPSRLREQVTSRGGTTAAALEVLERADVRGIFGRAVAAAAQRAAELADQFGSG